MVHVGRLLLCAGIVLLNSEAKKLDELPSATLRASVLPFSKIADEIHEAEMAAEDLKYKVGNSTEEKNSVQWFLATAMKELTNLQKVELNSSVEGSLGYKYERCTNNTSVKMPGYNQSLTFGEAVQQDDKLAPNTVEARMYEVYQLEQKKGDLTTALGECAAKCQLTLIARGRGSRAGIASARQPAPAPGPAPAPAPGGGGAAAAGGPPQKPSPRELMRSVAGAIFNTTLEISNMKKHLAKDDSAKSVLKTLSSLVTEKLLKAKHDVEQMKKDLEHCLHTPKATRLSPEVSEAMSGNTEVTLDLVNAAESQVNEAQKEVTDLEGKLGACRLRCA